RAGAPAPPPPSRTRAPSPPALPTPDWHQRPRTPRQAASVARSLLPAHSADDRLAQCDTNRRATAPVRETHPGSTAPPGDHRIAWRGEAKQSIDSAKHRGVPPAPRDGDPERQVAGNRSNEGHRSTRAAPVGPCRNSTNRESNQNV